MLEAVAVGEFGIDPGGGVLEGGPAAPRVAATCCTIPAPGFTYLDAGNRGPWVWPSVSVD